MKAKIVITTADESGDHKRSEIWAGEMEILDKTEYLLRFSVIAEGQPQPLVDVPFALGMGHWIWLPDEED